MAWNLTMIMRIFYFLLASVKFISYVWAQNQNSPLVRTSQGNVIGSVTDTGINVFYGIPYAGNPSGSNRFKPPPAAPNYPGNFHAIDSTRICAQPSVRGLIGEEDCLVLSIYSKNLRSSSPVIVFLEGEEYAATTKNFIYSFEGLLDQGNLLVTLNYRLSIMGFLCLGIEDAPGNAGLYDVIAALKWISHNIGGFGGNPENVVLFGHGSGAAMVDLVTLSPLSVGLVHKAIVSSGTALAPWAVSYTPIENAKVFSRTLQYTGKTKEELAEALAKADLNVLMNILSTYQYYNNTVLFAPCVENVALRGNATFLPDAPINILRSGNYRQIPYITGYTNREGTVRAGQAVYDSWLSIMNTNFSEFLPGDLSFTTKNNKTDIAASIKSLYFGTNPITMASIEDYFDYFGDTMFVISILRGAKERAATSSAAVRLYQLAYRGTHNSDWVYNIQLTGARHGSILNYLFDFDLKSGDENIRRHLLARWSSFAATGSPKLTNSDVDWQPVGTNLLHMVYSGGEIQPNLTMFTVTLGINPHEDVLPFWNSIYQSHYAIPRAVVSSAYCFRLSLISFWLCSFLFLY